MTAEPSEQPSDEERAAAWTKMATELAPLEKTLTEIDSADYVRVNVLLRPGLAATMIRARQALGRGDLRGVQALLEMVDPILHEAASELNRRMAKARRG